MRDLMTAVALLTARVSVAIVRHREPACVPAYRPAVTVATLPLLPGDSATRPAVFGRYVITQR